MTVTNSISRDKGSLKVMKEFNALTSGFDGTFDLLVDCSVDSFDQTVTLAAGGEETISGIPTGTTCEVTEPTLPTAPDGWTFGTPVVDPAGEVEITDKATTYTVTVTNSISREPGAIEVLKIDEGAEAALAGASRCGTT